MVRRLKILFYIHALAGGGAERVWSVMASRFAAGGHEVILAVDYDAAQNVSFVDAAVRVVVLGGNHLQSVWRLRGLLRAERPDIAISALAAANVKLALAAALCGRLDRTILTYHGYAETEPQRLSQIGFRAAAVLTRITARTVVVSDGLGTYLRQRWHASASRMARIYNPVQVTPGGATTVAALEARPPVILAAGRFVSYKNFTGLLEAFAALPRPDARLILLGDGPQRALLAEAVVRLGLEGRVEMPGYVPEPWRHFDRARCFVLPSSSEPFGLVLVEAMARGLDVVATDCHGPREILADGLHGALVPCNDPAALTAALAAALRKPSAPERRIARAQDFDADTATNHYRDLFHSVVAERDTRGGWLSRLKPRRFRHPPFQAG
ncbi:glycosyltransferase [Lichenihabitans sp. Uapishka_5]|uniref:glycosyltransferase n=1 Tax=Lichenihabitans sp. Uapishka_5 TaxID=3037302 RepID=UPI0029E7DC25|nr:glycosyltransferase [Lichenihabitans sp. Uapishka_5]MDX7950457.1 glycosyltransferase [Lichenihabitans sp. Uapishka_5]